MAYSADTISDTLAALAANGGNVNQTSRDTGISGRTIRRWEKQEQDTTGKKAAEHTAIASGGKNAEQKKQALADRLEGIAWKLAGALEDEKKIREAKLHSVSTAFGTVVDKIQLLRGDSTEITEIREHSPRELIRRRLDRLASERRN